MGQDRLNPFAEYDYLQFPTVTKPKKISHVSEIYSKFGEIVDYLVDFIENKCKLTGSGWTLYRVESFTLHIFKYNPLKIKSYLPLPKELQNKIRID